MKKMLIPLFVLMLFVSSCSENITERTVKIFIPEHPWEKYADASLWYELRWNEDSSINKLFVDANTREISIKVKTGQTVVICAYPLGEMRPFGGAITPLISSNTVTLDQDYGCLCDLMLDSELGVVSQVNTDRVFERLKNVTDDARLIDDSKFVQDMLNGKIEKSSFQTTKYIEVKNIACLSGWWVSESIHDNRVYVDKDTLESIELPVGIHRFYNSERNLEMRLVVSEDKVYKYERQGLVPNS